MMDHRSSPAIAHTKALLHNEDHREGQASRRLALDFRNELERVFQNPRFADIAMEAMPPIDYDKLATKDNLNALGSDLRAEMADLRGDLRTEMADMRGELRVEMANMRSDMNEKFVSQMRLAMLMQLVTLGTIVSYLSIAL